jgi:hypothetical protein
MSNSPRTWPERVLRFMLRYIGAASLLALIAVFMPEAWMDATHRALGMGPLPAEPIVGYLARSLSMFYALMGGLLLICSFDPRRHRSVLCYLASAFVFFGIVIWRVDFFEGMPDYWKHAEGPGVILIGAAILTLALRLNSRSSP